jgi:hypothetical protein
MAMSIPCQRRCWIPPCTRPEGVGRSRRVRIRMSKLRARQSGSRSWSCDEIDLSLTLVDRCPCIDRGATSCSIHIDANALYLQL